MNKNKGASAEISKEAEGEVELLELGLQCARVDQVSRWEVSLYVQRKVLD